MSFPPDSLIPFLLPPVNPGQGFNYTTGRIVAWNPETFENTVSWNGGAHLTNVAVLSGPDALTYQQGDVVGMVGWNPRGGTSSWAILGRLITPGAGSGEQVIDWMTTSLASAISAAVLADRIHVASVPDTEAATSTSYSDLATVGPSVTDVEISSAGKALVLASALVELRQEAGVSRIGAVSFEVSGATSVSPSDDSALINEGLDPNGFVYSDHIRAAAATVVPLNEGTHTFTQKYRGTTTGSDTAFSDRTLVVIAF